MFRFRLIPHWSRPLPSGSLRTGIIFTFRLTSGLENAAVPSADDVEPYVNLTVQASSAFPFHHTQEPVAQLVEHRTFNAVVAGSSPARLTKLLKIIKLFLRVRWVEHRIKSETSLLSR
jgi:hypothetical protein